MPFAGITIVYKETGIVEVEVFNSDGSRHSYNEMEPKDTAELAFDGECVEHRLDSTDG